jgi:DNA (cytosine-5)-methyltransferase 1
MAHTFYEFFAGGGMARIGLGPAWRCAFANDVDVAKARAYADNHGSAALAVKDVREVSPSELPGRADLAWASFPCQDLSLAGRGAGLGGERSGLFWPFWTLMRRLAAEGRAPRTIAIENVVGILTSKSGRDFTTIADAIASLGYRFGAIVIDAAAYGPQSRPRVFVICIASGLTAPLSAVSEGPAKDQPSSLVAAHARLTPATARNWLWWRTSAPPARVPTLASIIDAAPDIPWHSEAQTARLLSLMSEANLQKVRSAQSSGMHSVGAVYRRTRKDGDGRKQQRAEVRFDGLAGCLRTPGGGSSRQTLLFVDGARVRSRLLTTREAARLMGLPDTYRLPARYNEAYHLVGDGVAVPVVRAIAGSIIEPVLGACAIRDSA